MPFFWQGQQILGEESNLVHMHREFTGTGAEQISTDADVIAEIQQLVEFESFFADRVFFNVDLQPLAVLL